jgi:hypothetical protein
MLSHSCINTATTSAAEPPPLCQACQEIFAGKRCAHEGGPCPTKDGTPLGDAGGCPCDHCYPRTRATGQMTVSDEFFRASP